MLKLNLLSFFFFLVARPLLGQSSNIEVKVKDHHYSSITSGISDAKGHIMLSSDQSGKIIISDANTLNYIDTVRESDGITVNDMRLIKNDSILLFTKEMPFNTSMSDSLVAIRLHDKKILFNKALSVDFLNQNSDKLTILSESNTLGQNYINVLSNEGKQIVRMNSAHKFSAAAISIENKLLAFSDIEFSNGNTKIHLADYESKKILNSIQLGKDKKNIALYFDGENNLYGIFIWNESNKISIHQIKDGSLSKPLFSKSYNSFYSSVKANIKNEENTISIIISSADNNPHDYPILLRQKNKKINVLTIAHNLKAGIFSDSKLIFAQNFNQNFNDINGLVSIEEKEGSILKSYPTFTGKFFEGAFLQDGSMLIYNRIPAGPLLEGKYEVKLYEPGTFNDRYRNLNFTSYLLANHNIEKSGSGYGLINTKTGTYWFYGKYQNTFDYAFFKYTFIDDKIVKISDNLENNANRILDQNSRTSQILVSNMEYTNFGHTSPQEFQLHSNGRTTKLKGKYKFGKFSIDGKYLLTINSKNRLEIREITNQKVIFNLELKNGSYEVLALNENEFVVNIAYNQIDLNHCNREIQLINLERGQYVNEKKKCYVITDVISKNDKSLSLINGLAVLNEKVIINDPSARIKSSSLSKDGRLAIINYSNGQIAIYDTDSLNKICVMWHPSSEEHIFYDLEQAYFSNTDANSYLAAKLNKENIEVKNLDSLVFNPKRILSILGTPNEVYLNTLNQAMSLKKNDAQKSNTTYAGLNQKRKSNLYVLTIGISDYQNDNFDLTFADKDAMDIAMLYGKTSIHKLNKYNEKFYGDRYELQSVNNAETKIITKYNGTSFSIPESLLSLESSGRYWLTNNFNDEFEIWDFKEGKRSSKFSLPKKYKNIGYTMCGESKIYLNPNSNTSFFLTDSNSDIFEFNLKTFEYKRINLPLDKDKYKCDLKNLRVLKDNNWLFFQPNHYENLDFKPKMSFQIGNQITKKLEQVIFDRSRFYKSFDKKKLIERVIVNPSLETISNNGNHIVFSDYDDKTLFYLNFKNDSIPTQIKIPKDELENFPQMTISEDGLTIGILHSKGNKTQLNRYRIKDGKKNASTNFESYPYLAGISNFENKLKWVMKSKPLKELSWLNLKRDSLFNHSSAFSFDKVYTKSLLNDEANQINIKKQLETFFKAAKKEDQVILFMAGHGLLNEEETYFFAPTDMDFANISKKGISIESILSILKDIKSENKLLLMDTCHSGKVLDAISSDGNSYNSETSPSKRGAIPVSSKNNSTYKVSDVINGLFGPTFLANSDISIISASSGIDVAYENETLSNGAFTSGYIKLIMNKLQMGPLGIGGYYDEKSLQKSIPLNRKFIDELFSEVMLLTNKKQLPDLRQLNEASSIKIW